VFHLGFLYSKNFAINLPPQLVQVKSLGSRKEEPPELQQSIMVATIPSSKFWQLANE